MRIAIAVTSVLFGIAACSGDGTEPKNAGLRAAGKIIDADVLQHDQRVAFHVAPRARPAGFKFGSRDVVE